MVAYGSQPQSKSDVSGLREIFMAVSYVGSMFAIR